MNLSSRPRTETTSDVLARLRVKRTPREQLAFQHEGFLHALELAVHLLNQENICVESTQNLITYFRQFEEPEAHKFSPLLVPIAQYFIEELEWVLVEDAEEEMRQEQIVLLERELNDVSPGSGLDLLMQGQRIRLLGEPTGVEKLEARVQELNRLRALANMSGIHADDFEQFAGGLLVSSDEENT